MADKFRWIGADTVTRSRAGSAGSALTSGHIYDVAVFTEEVVAEWVRTGHAEYVTGGGKNTVLDVQNGTMKLKAPKIGVK